MQISSTARFAHLLLRASVAFAFVYPAVTGWWEPYTWLGYMPAFARDIAASVGVGELVLLHLFGAVEIVLALWILSGWKIFWPSLAAAALLLGIVVFNPAEFPILFRDLSIAGLALALALMHLPRRGGLASPAGEV